MKRLHHILLLLVPSVLFGDFTLNINQGGFTNGTTATNGMSFGFVVDTAGNGFQAGSYESFNITSNGQFLSASGSSTDDWFVYGGNQGVDMTAPVTIFSPALGNGTISNVTDIKVNQVSQGDVFAIMWFPINSANVGDLYGFSIDNGATTNMIIPSDGGVSSAPSSLSTKDPSFSIVPEPSQWAVMLGGLVLCLAVWRRRQGA